MSAEESGSEFQRTDLCDEREGHRKALATLFRDQNRKLLLSLMARTGSKDEAWEVLQEAYATMLALDKPEAVGFLESYLWRTAHNLVIDRQRQRATYARLDPIALFEPEELAPSPESRLYSDQLLELLEQAIDGLTPKVLEAFILRVIHQLSFKEVAKQMDIGESAAKMHVARAMQYCQDYLDVVEATRRVPK
jgi:RNA polymerase sigma factor (sigma-70 family)